MTSIISLGEFAALDIVSAQVVRKSLSSRYKGSGDDKVERWCARTYSKEMSVYWQTDVNNVKSCLAILLTHLRSAIAIYLWPM